MKSTMVHYPYEERGEMALLAKIPPHPSTSLVWDENGKARFPDRRIVLGEAKKTLPIPEKTECVIDSQWIVMLRKENPA